MADPAMIRQFFMRCGIGTNNPAIAEEFLVSTGLSSVAQLKDFGKSHCKDWVYTHNKRPNVQFIGPAVVKDLTVLMFFARYQWRRNRAVTVALFMEDMKHKMAETMEEVKAQREREGDKDIVLGRAELLSGYENFKGRFEQKLSSIIGAADVNLMYVIRKDQEPGWVPTTEEEIELYAIRQDGPEWNVDNRTVMNILYSAANQPRTDGQENSNRQIMTWIEEYNAKGNGRGAVKAFKARYEGDAASQNREVLSRAKVEHLHYKDESVFSFERFTSELKDAFDGCGILYTERNKVEMYLDKIQPTSKADEVRMTKVLAREKNFTLFTEAATWMSTKMAEIYKDQIVRIRNYGQGRGGNRRIAEVHGRDNIRGRGGRFRGGRTGGRDGRGSRDVNRSARGGGRGDTTTRHVINGVSVSDPTRDFTGEEWSRLGGEGRKYINEKRSRNQVRRGNSDRDVSEARARGAGDETTDANATGGGGTSTITESSSTGSRGGRAGGRFGRGRSGG